MGDFRVVPMGGLCNRLRVVLSYREFVRNESTFDGLEVLWARSDGVSNAYWSDVFEPLEGVKFTDLGVMPAQDYAGPWVECGPVSSAKPEAPPTWTKGYADLKPKPHILARIAELKAQIGIPYIAIHARRTDHHEHAKQFGHSTSLEELFEWFQRHPGPLYFASESREAVDWFHERVNPIFVHRMPEPVAGYDQRPGTLTDSVVDLFMCVGAKDFAGTWISSFSETIDIMRLGGDIPGGFVARVNMPSTEAEYYRGRPDLAEAWIKERMR